MIMNFDEYLEYNLQDIRSSMPFRYQTFMSTSQATACVNHAKSNKNLYCWWTFKHRSDYYAIGPYVNKLIIDELEMSNDDPIEYFKNGVIVHCDHYRPKMKGGHRINAYANTVSRKEYRSKVKRHKLRKQRNITRQIMKKNGLSFVDYSMFRYLYSGDISIDSIKAAWESVPSF